jgi:NAD(P)-dependent dehydrogenase (short-subunit alcohol dehydrogenase family)
MARARPDRLRCRAAAANADAQLHHQQHSAGRVCDRHHEESHGRDGKTVDEIAQKRINAIPAGRFGNPLEFGQLCANICSVQASYTTGQNFPIGGGGYSGTF